MPGVSMQRDAEPHRRTGTERRQHRLVWAPIAITLALGACSGSPLREDIARRPPSVRIAVAALASGAPELALRVADLELAKNPNNVPALIARGDALYALRRPAQAQVAYRDAVKLEPEAAAAQVGLGRTLAQTDPVAAEVAFLRALSHEPDNVVALNNLGVVRDLQGRHAEAREAYSHAISVAPTSADVQINLGMSLVLAGRTSAASRLLRGIASDPEARQAWRPELLNALTLAGDGAWAQQELPINPVERPQGNTAIAENAEPTPKGPLASGVALAQRRLDLPPGGQPTKAPPGSKAPENGGEAPLTAPLEVRQTPAIASDTRAQVLATSLPPVVPRGPDPSLVKPAPSTPELAPDISDTRTPTGASPVAFTGPLDRPDQYAAAIMLQAESVASASPDPLPDNFYVQLASLTSEVGAFSEWDRLQRRLPQFLGDRDPTVTRVDVHGRTYWRLRLGFADSLDAKQMCRQLEGASLHCLTGRGT